MATHHFDLEVDRSAISEIRAVDVEPAPLAAGQVRCRIDTLALTANNVTYAAVGEEIGYWSFFPASGDGWGRVPAWGFATVVESRHPDVAEGGRCYGYWPMSSELVVEPVGVSRHGFRDGAAHRRELPAIYNDYQRRPADRDPTVEALESLLVPLFMTSFLIDDFLADNDFFGASRVILSSASSKTAFGTAFQLARRDGCRAVGLTSPGNRDFVAALACYDEVLAYDAVEDLDAAPSVYVDIAGNTPLRRRIHARLGDALRYSCAVGYAHLGTLEPGAELPGPRPQFFFAPAQAKKRAGDWRDSGGVAAHFQAAWEHFQPVVADQLELVRHAGPDAAMAAWQRAVAGELPANEGHVLRW